MVPPDSEAGWTIEPVCMTWRRRKSLAQDRNRTAMSGLSSPQPGQYIEYAVGKIAEVTEVVREPSQPSFEEGTFTR